MDTKLNSSQSAGLLLLLATVVCLLGCAPTDHTGLSDSEYESWKTNRYNQIADPYGWPSAAGLFPIRNTLQYFGSDEENDFIFPAGSPPSIGVLEKYGDSIIMNVSPIVTVIVDEKPVQTARLYSDQDEWGANKANWNHLQWYVVKRQDQYFLRLKDTLSIYRSRFSDIPYYPYDGDFRIKATFTPASPGDSTQYDNIIGMQITAPIEGKLSFTYKDTTYSLTALRNNDQSYFVIFADATTGKTTYPGGRYLYPDRAGTDGETWLDFNKAINPPCVFTPHATCPLPPKENRLPFPVEAGEKNLKLYE